jgi:hypothetical protein
MTEFLDGPAAGQTLMLKRAPKYLRAVQAATGDWDALDQLIDTPRAGERVVAYRMVEGPFRAHICARGRNRSASGWYEGGRYRVCDSQPTDEQLRETAAWRAWVSEQVGRPVGADGAVDPQGRD